MHTICEDEFGGGRPHNGKKCFRISPSYHEQIYAHTYTLKIGI